MKRIVLGLALCSLLLTIWILDASQWLSLTQLKLHLDTFTAWHHAAPWLSALLFFGVYVVITALSFPGAALMTLAAGALFGVWWGTVVVSFASSIGATLAFLLARYLLHDMVQQRFAERLQAVNQGVAKQGAFYLFTLRLVPAVPFFLINILMGLTPIPTRTFYWVSQLGMLAGTLVYVNAGTQLAQLQHLSDIVSLPIILSLTLLGLFPWLAKALLAWLRRRRVYAQFTAPKQFDRNLIVIGAGAGGLVTAYIAAAVKAKVTLIEANHMGGDCLNYGCVPSKALIKSAKVAHQLRHAAEYGVAVTQSQVVFKLVMQRVQAVIKAIAPHDSVERYRGLGVEVLQGYAVLLDPWTVEIQGPDGQRQRLTSRSIVLATGARPFVPPLAGLEQVGYVTSDTIWQHFAALPSAPKRLVVLGGGPIGCELSQAFARLDIQVTQVEMSERLLIREDVEVSNWVQQQLQQDGVTVLTAHKALQCLREGDAKILLLQHHDQTVRIEFDEIVCAVGRIPRLQGYGLEELGITTDRTIVTNEYLETLYPNIYAVGDVAGPYQFTHTAAHQAWYAAVNALFGTAFKRFKVDYRVIPWCTFVDPEVARVGLNEQEAQTQGIAYEVTRFELAELDRAITEGATQGFVKVLTKPKSDQILGVTLVGAGAGDLMAEFVLAMKHRLGLNKILGTIHSYPTWAEANKYAAGEWKRQHAPQSVLRWLARYHRWRRKG